MNWLVPTSIFRKKILTNKILQFKCENSGISHPVHIKVTKRKKTISIRIDKKYPKLYKRRLYFKFVRKKKRMDQSNNIKK